MRIRSGLFKTLLEELLLYSGQFGLFYIIMQLIREKGAFFTNTGHLGLSISLVIQAILLSYFGNKTIYRLALSFIVPSVYTLLELSEGTAYLLNTAHLGFWIYAVVSSAFMVMRGYHVEVLQRITEICFVFINVFIFIFLYFYFDTWKEVGDNAYLTINIIFTHLPTFLTDSTHWFIITGGTLLAVTTALGRYEIARLKDKIARLFGTYVDSNIRDTIIDQGEFIAKKEKLCIVFSDIAGFTHLCEQNDASSIAKMLNTYFEYWNTRVKKYHGTIDKYIGDAIMIIFGLEQNARACDLAAMCAIDAYAGKQRLYEELRQKGLPIPNDFGIGCHYGELIIGDIGSAERKNFTVIGDTVNIASRLESATRHVKTPIIISHEVYENLDERLKTTFERLGEIDLKGKSTGILIWGHKSSEGSPHLSVTETSLSMDPCA